MKRLAPPIMSAAELLFAAGCDEDRKSIRVFRRAPWPRTVPRVGLCFADYLNSIRGAAPISRPNIDSEPNSVTAVQRDSRGKAVRSLVCVRIDIRPYDTAYLSTVVKDAEPRAADCGGGLGHQRPAALRAASASCHSTEPIAKFPFANRDSTDPLA